MSAFLFAFEIKSFKKNELNFKFLQKFTFIQLSKSVFEKTNINVRSLKAE